jgi:hypothetical protein
MPIVLRGGVVRELLLAVVPGLVMAAVSCADDLVIHPAESWAASRLGVGHCAPCCPVRPDQFGFYATHWRPWPGFVPIAPARSTGPLIPATPPRSVVPDRDREGDAAPQPHPAFDEGAGQE